MFLFHINNDPCSCSISWWSRVKIHIKIYHPVNRLRSFLLLGHSVTRSFSHSVTRSFSHYFQHAHGLTNTQHKDLQVCFADKNNAMLFDIKTRHTPLAVQRKLLKKETPTVKVSQRHNTCGQHLFI